MADQSIFFSYARDNSEFVIELAKRLKADGKNVWLDQIDIPAGSRWDLEIQRALEKANVLLIVLTPTSAISNNVMDEVSFAIEENKKIVPVLVEDCDLPFRLRRFQYVDYTTNNEAAYQNLLRALRNPKSEQEVITEKKKADRPVREPKAVSKPVIEKETKSKGVTQQSKMKQYIPYLVIAFIVMAGLLWWFTQSDPPVEATETTQEFTEQNYWEGTVLPSTNIEVYQQYLQMYPQGKYYQAALDSITSLSNGVENELWQESLETNTVASYYSYLNSYPTGRYTKLANSNIQDLNSWDAASKANRVSGFLDYRVQFGKNCIYAKELLSKINDADDKTSGWLYASSITDSLMSSSSIFHVVCTDQNSDGEVNPLKIPEKGDIVKNVREARFTYSSESTSGSRQTTIKKDQLGLVDDVSLKNGSVKLKLIFSK